MIAAIRLRQPADLDQAAFQERAATALRALAGRPGYLRGTIGRATDDAAAWLLLTEWESVGAYRRALGNFQVKVDATPLLAEAVDESSAFEELLVIGANGAERVADSDRAGDADWVPRTAPAGSSDLEPE